MVSQKENRIYLGRFMNNRKILLPSSRKGSSVEENRTYWGHSLSRDQPDAMSPRASSLGRKTSIFT